MQWRENGVILSSKPFAENSRIVTLFNRTIGKTSGLVRGVKTSIQLGDIDDVLWRGRTIEQLGTFRIENIFSPFTHAFNDCMAVFAIESVCCLCYRGFPEKAPHPELFDALKALLLSISRINWLVNYVFFEIKLLADVGFGLDLSKCAVTGKSDDLRYVSPRTGCAVSEKAGEKYKDRLFVLPQFLIFRDNHPMDEDIFCALRICEHFLKACFCGINGGKLPLSRACLMAELSKRIEREKSENQRNRR
ncbi:MAG: DNA repair protein RecO [Holosporaceae bacterium]|nr:DNA repair protein RecO [Holosporaceae bacterium]